jgi:hypothetical protein
VRQLLSIQEHFGRGNACSHPDCRATIPGGEGLSRLPDNTALPVGHRREMADGGMDERSHHRVALHE